jgi:SAM-dependent methyltransferase
LISEIKNNIQSHVSVDALLNFILSKSFISSQYFSDFNYLRRDWCGENDDEIKLITDYLIEYIPKDETDKPILFLGAGLARIPCNLANIFSNIYAVDNSVTMANLFFKVKSQDIDFYEIVYKNAASASDMVSRLTASSQFIPKEQMKKIKYIVSDGNHLPFPDNFFSNIVSVYFSDVTPFPELLRELNRVLINKGNFIHLGPLEYHFRDRSSMYSYDELKDVLKKNNYSIEKETSIELPHCLSHNEKSKKLYTNWVFLAKKREVSQTIENNSIFKLLVDIKFEQKIQLSSKDCIVLTEAIMPNGERFEGAEAILDFLRLVDGKRNFSEIISHLESEYGAISDLDRSKFITILNTLLSKSLLAKL